MQPIRIPEDYNYIAAFLTLNCNLRCSYCINEFSEMNRARKLRTGKEWIEFLNQIELPESNKDLPITLQGGEPSLHPDFYEIINGIRPDLNIDLLTNCQFDPYDFIRMVSPERIKRAAPYASIRVSYHPRQQDMWDLARKVALLHNHGYDIGIWSVDHPSVDAKVAIRAMREICAHYGIDFRTKEFLGTYDGRLYGEYKYSSACNGKIQEVFCKTTELLISPEISIHRCHADLYQNRHPIYEAQINKWLSCNMYGTCNPCDIKVKTNRFQKFGHTSVQIEM